MNRPLISIVTVVLNNRSGIERTWHSISKQLFRDFEWIVVDGASTDGTLEYILGLGTGVCRLCSGRDQGLYDAMNRGTGMAAGQYVCYLNSGDCFLGDNSLLLVSSILCGCQSSEILFAGALYSFGNGVERIRGPREFSSGVRHGNPCVHQAAFFPRALLGQAPYSLAYRVCGDYYLFAHLYMQGAVAKLLRFPVVRFEAGGLSHQHRGKLFSEAASIQRNILKLSGIRIAVSKARRWLSYFVYSFLIWRSRS